jgi:hypothetical protein
MRANQHRPEPALSALRATATELARLSRQSPEQQFYREHGSHIAWVLARNRFDAAPLGLVAGLSAYLEVRRQDAHQLHSVKESARGPVFGCELEQTAPQLRAFLYSARERSFRTQVYVSSFGALHKGHHPDY